jgi:hypothetical protein
MKNNYHFIIASKCTQEAVQWNTQLRAINKTVYLLMNTQESSMFKDAR